MLVVRLVRLAAEQRAAPDRPVATAEGALDEDIGVAVEFEEEEEDDDQEGDEVIEEDRDEDEDQPAAAGAVRARLDNDGQGDEDGQGLNAQEIDAYWLQRQVSKAFGGSLDANQAQQLADDVLGVLGSSSVRTGRGCLRGGPLALTPACLWPPPLQDDRDVENRLVTLLDFDKFDLIKVVLRNRTKVVWCTRLNRAQDEAERKRIEGEMAQAPETANILLELNVGPPLCLPFLSPLGGSESLADRTASPCRCRRPRHRPGTGRRRSSGTSAPRRASCARPRAGTPVQAAPPPRGAPTWTWSRWRSPRAATSCRTRAASCRRARTERHTRGMRRFTCPPSRPSPWATARSWSRSPSCQIGPSPRSKA